MSEPVYSGWIFTDATRLVCCPRCNAVAGEPCRTPKGRRIFKPHGERVGVLHDLHPGSIKAATHHA